MNRDTIGHFCNLLKTLNKSIAIALTGSVSKLIDPSAIPADVDFFCFTKNLPLSQQIAKLFQISQFDLRMRQSFLETKFQKGEVIVNIKFSTYSHVDKIASTSPTLDDQYLEELESFLNLELIHDDKDSMANRISHLSSVFESSILLLRKLSLERFIRAVVWMRGQGIVRKDLTSFHLLHSKAWDSLILLAYLLHNRCPPSVKWRFHKASLLSLGEPELFAHFARSNQSAASPSDQARILQEAEESLSNGGNLHPWTCHPSRWWWTAKA